MSLLKLPDELLLHIASYLPSSALVPFSCTCSRLHHILTNDTNLFRDLSFEDEFTIKESSVKQLLMPIHRARCVQSLNINGCFWFTASFFRSIHRLRNLKELHLLACNVSERCLRYLLLELPDVNVLSWTWPKDLHGSDFTSLVRENDQFSRRMADLQTLIIEIHQMRELLKIIYLLRHCTHLKRLEVLGERAGGLTLHLDAIITLTSRLNWISHLHELETLRIWVYCDMSVMPSLLGFCSNLCLSQTNHNPYHGDGDLYQHLVAECRTKCNVSACAGKPQSAYESGRLFYSNTIKGIKPGSGVPSTSREISVSGHDQLENLHTRFPNLQDLMILRVADGVVFPGWQQFPLLLKNCRHLTHLTMTDHTMGRMDPPAFLVDTQLPSLQVIRMPFYYLCGGKAGPPRKKRKVTTSDRAGVATQADQTESSVESMCQCFPNLEEVHFFSAPDKMWSSAVKDLLALDLSPLSKLIRLKRLYLDGSPHLHLTHFLSKIATNCKQLETLYMRDAGRNTMVRAVVTALPKMNRLKNITLLNCHLVYTAQLFHALGRCSTLQRMLVSGPSDIEEQVVVDMAGKLQKLMVLAVGSQTTKSKLTRLQGALSKQLKQKFPGSYVNFSLHATFVAPTSSHPEGIVSAHAKYMFPAPHINA